MRRAAPRPTARAEVASLGARSRWPQPLPCLLGDTEPALARVETLGFARTEMFLVTHQQIRRTARVRVTSDFVAELMTRHRSALEG